MSFHDDRCKGRKLCYINHYQLSMHCDLTFDVLTRNEESAFSTHVTFHGDRCKWIAIMQHKPLSEINALRH